MESPHLLEQSLWGRSPESAPFHQSFTQCPPDAQFPTSSLRPYEVEKQLHSHPHEESLPTFMISFLKQIL